MRKLKVLICGAGCGGPALAYWLARCGHRVTVVERFHTLRASGAQIDLRNQGIDVVNRMGILDRIQDKLVQEDGVAMVDSRNKAFAYMMANRSGKGSQTVTSEYEIMRGDLVQILYDITKQTTRYTFGKTVDHFEQSIDGVDVTYSDGQRETFDVLVGADGQNSQTRSAMLPPDYDVFQRLSMHVAYFFVPRSSIDDRLRKVYTIPSRWIMSRTHNSHETQVYFWMRGSSSGLRRVHQRPIAEQKSFWSDKFRDAGWQVGRFLQGMEKTDNWFSQEVVQVKIDKWHQGRVVLLADAAYCPSPMSGMGTTGALVGAYVLAGELQRNVEDLEQAFTNYHRVMRPFVDEMQQVRPMALRLAYPNTWLGVYLFRLVTAILCFFRFPQIKARLSSGERGGWRVPDYHELRHANSSRT